MARAAAVAAVAAGTAACSSDTSRFGEDPFSNPFSTSQAAPRHEPASTGSIMAAPSTRVQRSPLGAPGGAQSRPMYGYGSGASQGGYRSSSMEPRSTGSIGAPAPSRIASAPLSGGSSSNWSSRGGSVVTLRQGETVEVIAQRYGVPAGAILQANNLQPGAYIGAGQQLTIPTYSGSARPAAPMEPSRMAASPTAPSRAAPGGRMQLTPGPQGRGAPLASAPAAPKPVASVAKPEARAFAAAPVKPATATEPNDTVKTAALKVDPAPAAAAPDSPAFRWPVRGRVISGFGSKTSGSSNDGINLAVPEGTEVKASDDGVVAYAGSELKGFGNLVLIRHSNGYVTAYAHNSALSVKRGDPVRRGQIIAKSGATGNVSSPQLHFEVRQGSKSIDPMGVLPNA